MALIDPIELVLRKLFLDTQKAMRLNRTRIATNVSDLSAVVAFAQDVVQQQPSPAFTQTAPCNEEANYSCLHDDELLTEKEAAQFLKTHPGTLANWRSSRVVIIPYVRIGRMIRYRRSVLEKMMSNATAS